MPRTLWSPSPRKVRPLDTFPHFIGAAHPSHRDLLSDSVSDGKDARTVARCGRVASPLLSHTRWHHATSVWKSECASCVTLRSTCAYATSLRWKKHKAMILDPSGSGRPILVPKTFSPDPLNPLPADVLFLHNCHSRCNVVMLILEDSLLTLIWLCVSPRRHSPPCDLPSLNSLLPLAPLLNSMWHH